VDAAIIFSDILVVPEAMGLDYEMLEAKGPRFPTVITTADDVNRLRDGEDAAAGLEYVFHALRLAKRSLNGHVPLIGFAGAPWTIMAYMVEGGGSKTFSKARRLLYQNPDLSHRLLAKITQTTIAYLKAQVRAGADLIQLFDSWAGELTPEQYRNFAIPYLSQICNALPEVPKTVFAKGAGYALPDLNTLSCEVVGLDWTIEAPQARKHISHKVLQGNLDPCVLFGSPELVSTATRTMLQQFGPRHIANLGHGVYPDTPLEGVQTFIDTVKAYRYNP
jgi:uroporphyrinogen decarboxylase